MARANAQSAHRAPLPNGSAAAPAANDFRQRRIEAVPTARVDAHREAGLSRPPLHRDAVNLHSRPADRSPVTAASPAALRSPGARTSPLASPFYVDRHEEQVWSSPTLVTPVAPMATVRAAAPSSEDDDDIEAVLHTLHKMPSTEIDLPAARPAPVVAVHAQPPTRLDLIKQMLAVAAQTRGLLDWRNLSLGQADLVRSLSAQEWEIVRRELFADRVRNVPQMHLGLVGHRDGLLRRGELLQGGGSARPPKAPPIPGVNALGVSTLCLDLPSMSGRVGDLRHFSAGRDAREIQITLAGGPGRYRVHLSDQVRLQVFGDASTQSFTAYLWSPWGHVNSQAVRPTVAPEVSR